jgi:hypothetical protein
MNAKLGTSGSTLKKMSSDICYGKLEKAFVFNKFKKKFINHSTKSSPKVYSKI